MDARPGDRLVVDSAKVGTMARHGDVVEVLGSASHPHYRVRWDDGHETTLFPSPAVHVEPTRRR